MPKQKGSIIKSTDDSAQKAKKAISKPAKAAPKSSLFHKTIAVYGNQKDYFLKNEKWSKLGLSTRCIHAGSEPDPVHGGVNPSIELSTTYAQPSPGSLASCYDYTRCGNPTVMALQRNLAAMEGSKFAFALNTGLSAITLVMSLLKHGDHLLCIDDVYGGTQRYLNKVYQPQTKIEFDMIDMLDLGFVATQFKPNTKIVWAEAPTNPTLKCVDIAGLAKLCKKKNALLIIDNTFMSPVLQNPLALGADIVMHSITKYIGGHSDVVAGALCFDSGDLYDQLYFNMKSMGTCIAPFDSYMALKGSKTMKIRVDRAAESALAIAKWLEKHPKIERVLYPGLPSHPNYANALKNRSNKKQTGGGVCTLAESLGGVETLIESPALMTHGSVPPEKRAILGIADNFVRLSTGVEEVEDLIADMDQALKKI